MAVLRERLTIVQADLGPLGFRERFGRKHLRVQGQHRVAMLFEAGREALGRAHDRIRSNHALVRRNNAARVGERGLGWQVGQKYEERFSQATKIFYRLRYAMGTSKTFATSPVRTLQTALPSNPSVFAIQADPHMDENSSADVFRNTLQQILAVNPSFLLDLGDIWMVDKLQSKTEANIRARFQLMQDFYSVLEGRVPLRIALGNHDGELGYSTFNTKKYRAEYFPAQTSELAYYSFTGPNSLFVVLDPFTFTTNKPSADGWSWTLGRVQYDWLEQTLSTSTAQHKFVFIHHLLQGDAAARGGIPADPDPRRVPVHR
mgnify:CR=1 FL=1